MAPDSLAKANARRHPSALIAAQDAIEQLCREGAAINFGAVSRASGVSRAWLYRQADLRDSIGRRSSAPPRRPAAAAQRASNSSLRQRLESAKAEIGRLLSGEQRARQLGVQRAATKKPIS